jgi:hypothetical protein
VGLVPGAIKMTVADDGMQNTNKYERSKRLQLNVILAITFVLHGFATLALVDISQQFSRWMPPTIWNLLIGLSVAAMVAELTLLVLSWTRFQQSIEQIIIKITNTLSRLGSINLLIIAILISVHGYFVFGPIGQHTRSLPTFTFSYWIVTLLGSILLKAWSSDRSDDIHLSWVNAILAASLLTAFGHVITASLSRISDYPLTRDWSETSRYYYASLFTSKLVYGVKIPLPVLHPSEYLTLSPPYLIPNSTLWLHRAWQQFLVISLPLFTAFLLSYRLAVKGYRRLLFVVWVFLYLAIGPVYYHLLIPVIIVLWGYAVYSSNPSRARLFKSFVLIGIASVWAGISRVNWFPVPGLLAATLYFLETPLQSTPSRKAQIRRMLSYLIEPVLWVAVGTVIAILSYGGYMLISGNPLDYFATSFTSALLWYRLLPSPTYPPGILTGTLIVSLPMILIIIGTLIEKINQKSRWQYFHPLRYFGIGAILLVLFVGGIVVSTKIGGGSNLHNMDAFLVILIVTTAAVFFKHARPEHLAHELEAYKPQSLEARGNPQRLQLLGLVLSVIILSVFTLIGYSPPDLLPMQKEVKRSVNAINKYIDAAKENHSSVLFISNRHMLNFNYKDEIELLPDYERVFLMEMAMAGDEGYLNQFYADLRNQRFDLIIVEPLYDQIKGAGAAFGEENDIWVELISKPILCYYEELRILRLVHVQILVPRENGTETCSSVEWISP